MVAPLLIGGIALAAGVGGYFLGTKYSIANVKSELNILVSDAKIEEQAIVAKIKSWLAGL